MKIWQKIGVIGSLWSLSASVYCDQKQAMQYYSTYDYGKSFIEFSVLAEQDDVLSQFMLGIMFLDEKCVCSGLM